VLKRNAPEIMHYNDKPTPFSSRRRAGDEVTVECKKAIMPKGENENAEK
jgi:hypothetical protein